MKNINIKIPSNRNFGIVFFVFFLLVGIYPLLYQGDFRIWSMILSLIFLILGLFNSKILSPLNKIWFNFGIFLGHFISPIVMGIIFFAVVTPTSLLMRLFNKNLLGLKRKNTQSYWIDKENLKSNMKKQF